MLSGAAFRPSRTTFFVKMPIIHGQSLFIQFWLWWIYANQFSYWCFSRMQWIHTNAYNILAGLVSIAHWFTDCDSVTYFEWNIPFDGCFRWFCCVGFHAFCCDQHRSVVIEIYACTMLPLCALPHRLVVAGFFFWRLAELTERQN